jgi:hypothetical protein
VGFEDGKRSAEAAMQTRLWGSKLALITAGVFRSGLIWRSDHLVVDLLDVRLGGQPVGEHVVLQLGDGVARLGGGLRRAGKARGAEPISVCVASGSGGAPVAAL